MQNKSLHYFALQNDLVCKDKMLPSIVKMMLFAGVFVGTLGFGALSDMYVHSAATLLSANYAVR